MLLSGEEKLSLLSFRTKHARLSPPRSRPAEKTY
uniref:Uncharacterized protein n=1 Tax=Anguilla anguilla TaxID=7936 RepID=A0A0E9R824_ANGAN